MTESKLITVEADASASFFYWGSSIHLTLPGSLGPSFLIVKHILKYLTRS